MIKIRDFYDRTTHNANAILPLYLCLGEWESVGGFHLGISQQFAGFKFYSTHTHLFLLDIFQCHTHRKWRLACIYAPQMMYIIECSLAIWHNRTNSFALTFAARCRFDCSKVSCTRKPNPFKTKKKRFYTLILFEYNGINTKIQQQQTNNRFIFFWGRINNNGQCITVDFPAWIVCKHNGEMHFFASQKPYCFLVRVLNQVNFTFEAEIYSS